MLRGLLFREAVSSKRFKLREAAEGERTNGADGGGPGGGATGSRIGICGQCGIKQSMPGGKGRGRGRGGISRMHNRQCLFAFAVSEQVGNNTISHTSISIYFGGHNSIFAEGSRWNACQPTKVIMSYIMRTRSGPTVGARERRILCTNWAG